MVAQNDAQRNLNDTIVTLAEALPNKRQHERKHRVTFTDTHNPALPGDTPIRYVYIATAFAPGAFVIDGYLAEDDGGLISITVTNEDQSTSRVEYEFLPDESINTQRILALLQRKVARNMWLYHATVAREQELREAARVNSK